MHPQIEQTTPGDCPICGMALELKTVSSGDEEDTSELDDMSRRFWIGAALTLPVFLLAMAHLIPNPPAWVMGEIVALAPIRAQHAGGLVGRLAILQARLRFPLRTRNLNMFTLIAIGVGAAYALQRGGHARARDFPAFASASTDAIGIYFEAAAMITVLVLLGQVLEAARPRPHRRRHPRPPRPRPEDRAPFARRAGRGRAGGRD